MNFLFEGGIADGAQGEFFGKKFLDAAILWILKDPQNRCELGLMGSVEPREQSTRYIFMGIKNDARWFVAKGFNPAPTFDLSEWALECDPLD